MTYTYLRVSASMALLVAVTACTPKGPTPQQRFEGLYRACRALQGGTSVGVSYAAFSELLQHLATEILIASDHASSEDEKAMIKAYADVATTYKDSAILWKNQIESSKYEWTKGQILQEAELVPIVAKYKLPTAQQPVYGKRWPVLPADSMQRVWLIADEEAQKATRLYFALTDRKAS